MCVCHQSVPCVASTFVASIDVFASLIAMIVVRAFVNIYERKLLLKAHLFMQCTDLGFVHEDNHVNVNPKSQTVSDVQNRQEYLCFQRDHFTGYFYDILQIHQIILSKEPYQALAILVACMKWFLIFTH